MNHQRQRSLVEYTKTCPATGKLHDWRYATSAPGSYVSDSCARCQNCQLFGIKSAEEESRHG